MRLHAALVISARAAALPQLDQQQRGRRPADRLRFLRLLQREQVRTMQACVPILGDRRAQLTRWWARYRAGGREARLAEPTHPGSQGQMTAEAWADLEAAMKPGQIATLEQARQDLGQRWGMHSQRVHGVWWHLHRRRAHPKTGRRRQRRADPAHQEAFKNPSASR